MNSDTYDHFIERRSYTKGFEREITLKLDGHEYSVWLDGQIRFWSDDGMPEVDRLWPVQVFNAGGGEVTYGPCLALLQTMALDWCREHIDELVDEIERKENNK